MSRLFQGIAFGVLAIAISSAQRPVGAQDKKAGKPVVKTLPPGAFERLGTTKMRHGSRLLCLAYSPNGRILAGGGGDDPVRLWDVDSGDQLRTLPEAWVNAMVFSPRGSVVVTAGSFKVIRLWETASGKEINKLEGHKAAIRALAISPDGTMLASGDQEGTVILWELLTARVISTFKGHTDEITCLAFTPDSSTLASGSGDRTIRLWDVDNGKFIKQLDGGCMVNAVAFPDNKVLASGGDDNVIRLWDVAAAKTTDLLKGHDGSVLTLAAFRDATKEIALVSGAADGTIRIWALGEKAAGKHRIINRSTGDSDALTLTRTGDFLATGGVNNTIRIFEVASGKETQFEPGHQAGVHAMTLSPDGQFLATACTKGDIRVSAQVKPGNWVVTTHQVPAGDVLLAYSPDSKTLASVVGSHPIHLFDHGVEKARATLPSPAGDPALSLLWHGANLYVGRRSGKVEVWNVADKKMLHEVKYDSPAYALAVDLAGARLAVSGGNKVLLWSLVKNAEIKTFGSKEEGAPTTWPLVAALAFHPDGNLLALSCYDGSIRIVDPAREKDREIKLCEGHASVAYGMAFSRDGKTLATASFDRTVRLWETFSGQAIQTFKGHHGPGTAAAFAADGRSFFSGSADSSVLHWDATGLGASLPPLKLDVPELQNLWLTLASDETNKAHDALWRFVANGKGSADWIVKQLYLVDPKHIDQLFVDLRSEIYKTREKATAELERYGRWMENRLKEAAKNPDNTLEVQRRLEKMLARLNVPGSLTMEQERLRIRRAMMILEQIGDAAALDVLQKLGGGAPDPDLQHEAQAGAARLKTRLK